MRHRPLLLSALLALPAAACHDGDRGKTSTDAGTDADMEPLNPLGGGSFTPAGCDYTVTVREGATPPAAGQPTLGADPTPRYVHLGLAGDPASSMNFVWRTVDETTLATTVQYGLGDQTDQSAEGYTFTYPTAQRGDIRIHEAHLCGLQPDTVYSYRVGGKDGSGHESWSPVRTFRTAPPADRVGAPLTIAVLGDSRSGDASNDGYAVWHNIITQAAAHQPDLLLFSGDGTILGPVQEEWDQWLEAAKDVIDHVPLVYAHGNHEVNSVVYYSQFAMPGNEEYFSFDYGPVHVTALNDTPLDVATIANEQSAFLKTDLAAAATRPWKLAMFHKPFYTSSSIHPEDGKPGRDAWAPIIDQYKVDLVLNGHVHDYERSQPMRGGAVQSTPADGTIYLIAGGSGAPLYNVGRMQDFTATQKKTFNFGIIQINGNTLSMKAYDDMGVEFDGVDITK